MIRIVIDTNVVISGTFWAGASQRIINLIENRELVFVASTPILAEYDKVMHYEEIKQRVHHHQERVQAIQKVMQLSVIVYPTERLQIVKDDPDDDKFLEAAVVGKVNYLISKDHHLLRLKEFQGIKIVTPDNFLSILQK